MMGQRGGLGHSSRESGGPMRLAAAVVGSLLLNGGVLALVLGLSLDRPAPEPEGIPVDLAILDRSEIAIDVALEPLAPEPAEPDSQAAAVEPEILAATEPEPEEVAPAEAEAAAEELDADAPQPEAVEAVEAEAAEPEAVEAEAVEVEEVVQPDVEPVEPGAADALVADEAPVQALPPSEGAQADVVEAEVQAAEVQAAEVQAAEVQAAEVQAVEPQGAEPQAVETQAATEPPTAAAAQPETVLAQAVPATVEPTLPAEDAALTAVSDSIPGTVSVAEELGTGPAPAPRKPADLASIAEEISAPEEEPSPAAGPEPDPSSTPGPAPGPAPSPAPTAVAAAEPAPRQSRSTRPTSPDTLLARLEALKDEELQAKENPELWEVIRAVREQIARCWTDPQGAASSRRLRVDIDVAFGRDGSLLKARIKQPGELVVDEDFRDFAVGARQALSACSPFRLPAESYALWRGFTMRFVAGRRAS